MDSSVAIISYLGVGALCGVIAGLLGTGSTLGIFIIPALLLIFSAIGMSPELAMHIAIGTTVAVMVITGVTNVINDRKRGFIIWGITKRTAPFCVIGSALGAILADFMPAGFLKVVFEIALLILAYELLFGKKRAQRADPRVNAWYFASVGGVSSFFCSITGMGLGNFLIPLFYRSGIDMRRAIPTTSSCGVFYTVSGSLGYMLAGLNNEQLPSYSAGYIYLPALFSIGLGVVAFNQFGVRLNKMLSERTLRTTFGVLLAIVGTKMVLF